MLKLLVVEDHALVREGLMQTLRVLAEGDDAVEVRGAASADEALALLEADAGLDLILLDVMLPGTGGLALLGALRKRHAGVPVLMLSALDDAGTIGRAMRLGAAGFVPKASSTQTLFDAVREVLAGGHYLPPHVAGKAEGGVRASRNIQARFRLTAAQVRVLELLAEGKTNREIGEVIGVTEGTVKIHVSAIFKALNVANRTQAMLLAGRYGFKAPST